MKLLSEHPGLVGQILRRAEIRERRAQRRQAIARTIYAVIGLAILAILLAPFALVATIIIGSRRLALAIFAPSVPRARSERRAIFSPREIVTLNPETRR